MKKKKLIRNVLLIAVVLGIGAAIYGYKEFNRKSESITNETADFKVKPLDIITAFTDDEKAATLKYGGKIIQVAGLVKKLDKDELGNYTVVIGDNSSLSSVRCSVDSLFTKDVAALQLNTPAFLKGVCTGFNADEMGLGSDVILNRCVIVKD
ncbi:MAG: hypothetical protein ABL872_12235 [Lacibacter sp.]